MEKNEEIKTVYVVQMPIDHFAGVLAILHQIPSKQQVCLAHMLGLPDFNEDDYVGNDNIIQSLYNGGQISPTAASMEHLSEVLISIGYHSHAHEIATYGRSLEQSFLARRPHIHCANATPTTSASVKPFVTPIAVAPTVVAPTVIAPTVVAPAVVAPTVIAPTVIAPTVVAPIVVAPTVVVSTVVAPTVVPPITPVAISADVMRRIFQQLLMLYGVDQQNLWYSYGNYVLPEGNLLNALHASHIFPTQSSIIQLVQNLQHIQQIRIAREVQNIAALTGVTIPVRGYSNMSDVAIILNKLGDANLQTLFYTYGILNMPPGSKVNYLFLRGHIVHTVASLNTLIQNLKKSALYPTANTLESFCGHVSPRPVDDGTGSSLAPGEE